MNPDLYNSILAGAGVLICIALMLTVFLIAHGPNSLDRVIRLDGFIAMIQCALGVLICWSLDTSPVSAMLVIALLGFISTVSVARFRKRDDV